MKIQRRSASSNGVPKGWQLSTLLVALGFPREEVMAKRSTRFYHRFQGRRHEHFGTRELDRLHEFYHRAKNIYRTQIKKAHPDNGGNLKEAARLNGIWAKIEKVFARKYHIT